MENIRLYRCATLIGLIAIAILGGPVAVRADDGGIVRIAFATQAELAAMAARLDIWEVVRPAPYDTMSGTETGGYLIARITPADADWLRTQGIEVVTATSVEPATIPGYSCYRTIDELSARLVDWAAEYPVLTDLRSLGASYEGRALQVMRITNETTGFEKPVFFLMANIHGRELITPETAMAFIALLLDGYGVEPDVTWLLDHHRIEVMVSANPDGHVRNEAGWPWAYWRKNANPSYGLCPGSFGVDLNRNSSFGWGGASTYPCDELYQGPFAVSETETQAVQSFIRELFPDQRPFAADAPAPDDATGIFITLHSYGDLVLWPWGNTYAEAPNATQLAQLGRKLATFNGYIAQQASDLYPTTGATDDFAYGELGIATYTFEIGSSFDGFYPPCSRYDALIQPNLKALLYAAKVARTPYLTPAGPDALRVRASTELGTGSPVVTVTAEIDGRGNGGSPIAGAEVYLDLPPWQGGAPIALQASDGAFDSSIEDVSGTLSLTTSVADFTQSRHLAFVRARGADGAWGPFSAGFATMPYAVALEPEGMQGFGRAGEVVTYSMLLDNIGSLSQTLTLAHSAAVWPTTLVPTHTFLAAQASTPVTLTVSVPLSAEPVASDLVTVSVGSEDVAWLLKTTTVETHMLRVSLFLPFVVRIQ